MAALPRAILFDLDDTLIRAYAQPEEAWRRLLHVFAAHLDAHDAAAIDRVRVAVHGRGARLLDRSRPKPPNGGSISRVRAGSRCGADWPSSAMRRRGAGRPHRRRLHRDAARRIPALSRRPCHRRRPARGRGVKLALVTNGAAETQRDKIVRFELGHRFDHIQIEGEFGQGKPELAVYRHALERLEVDAGDAWMVGDNYEWEVVAPQRLGMCGIWYDPFEAGVPAHATASPRAMIKRLGELLKGIRTGGARAARPSTLVLTMTGSVRGTSDLVRDLLRRACRRSAASGARPGRL